MTDSNIRLVSEAYRKILGLMGEDAQREGLLKTPERAAKALDYLTSGYKKDPRAVLNGAIFHEQYDAVPSVV